MTVFAGDGLFSSHSKPDTGGTVSKSSRTADSKEWQCHVVREEILPPFSRMTGLK